MAAVRQPRSPPGQSDYQSLNPDTEPGRDHLLFHATQNGILKLEAKAIGKTFCLKSCQLFQLAPSSSDAFQQETNPYRGVHEEALGSPLSCVMWAHPPLSQWQTVSSGNSATVVRKETNHWQRAPKVLMDFSEKQKSQRNKSFKSLWISALARMQFWLLTIYVKQLKCRVFFSFLAVFILELAIFKVTVPAKGGNCISRVPGIKQRKEKGTEKVAAFTQRAQMFCFLPCSVCSKKKKKTLQ